MDEKKPTVTLTLGLAKPRPQPQHQVSTELTLWDRTWSTTTQNNNMRQGEEVPKPSSADHDQTTNASKHEKLIVSITSHPDDADETDTMNIEKLKQKSKTYVEKLSRLDSWDIKKTLKASDLRKLDVPTSFMKKHVLPYVDDKFTKGVESSLGAQVTVYDCDTHSIHP